MRRQRTEGVLHGWKQDEKEYRERGVISERYRKPSQAIQGQVIIR